MELLSPHLSCFVVDNDVDEGENGDLEVGRILSVF